MVYGGWTAPSEEELESMPRDFTTLGEDEYIAKITDIKVEKKPNRFPSNGDMEDPHDMIIVRAEALTFADGETLVDEKGAPVESTVPFQIQLNPKKRGMIPQPAKTRKFFAAVLGQNIGDPIDIADFGELIGKQVIVSLKPNNGYNNAQDFRPIKRQRTRATTTKGPVSGEELKTRARDVFDEDSPDNKAPLPKTGNDEDLDF